MKEQSKTYIDELATENSKFCIVALTGKVRAGTSDVCKLLTSSEFPDSATRPADTYGHELREIRENIIVYRYLHHNWKPFIHLSITDIIVSFILESELELLKTSYIDKSDINKSESSNQTLYDALSNAIQEASGSMDEVIKKASKISTTLLNSHHPDDIKEVDKTIKNYCQSNFINFTVESLLEYWEETRIRVYNKNTSTEDLFFCFGYLSVLRIKLRGILGKSNYTIAFQK